MNDKELASKLFRVVSEYNPEGLKMVKKAYEMAYEAHDGQKRKTGEPYIIHPIWVALILTDLKVDTDTLCAALLHDTVEDTNITLEKIEKEFNKEVATLVDGVTRISKLNFETKEEERNANLRKILMSITKDVRIIMIKLADRTHNMRTMDSMRSLKQKENSLETMEVYVPLAYRLGAYRIMHELEDKSFYYIDREQYKEFEHIRNALIDSNLRILEQMKTNINGTLTKADIANSIKIRFKNIYGIYDRMKKGNKLTDIHDLQVLKIMVKNIDDCYRSLRYVHELYHPVHNRFKDYICTPKSNMYQSLHTNVFGPNELLVQAQIRTFDMDDVASFGIAAYFDKNGEKARDKMQKAIREKYQFYKTLEDLDEIFGDNKEFAECVKRELLEKSIYVCSNKGDGIELPNGSTVIDYAYKISDKLGDNFRCAFVNDNLVSGDYVLKDNDIVSIVSDTNSKGPKKELANTARTEKAKQRILSKYEKNFI